MNEVTDTDRTHLITAAEAADIPIIIGTDPPHQEIGTTAKSIADLGQENTPRANEISTAQTEERLLPILGKGNMQIRGHL